ncbi:MAG: hypothetical protein EBY57_08445 [Actinobacteria bacterium]|nr:hypothetical protein [Actinomycetota bacterium]
MRLWLVGGCVTFGGFVKAELEDYSLVGAGKARAHDRGLVNAEWFLADVEPARMRELQERTNRRATIDTALWIGLTILAGWWLAATAWSWWSIPAMLCYGALYGGASDSRWHEMGHGTAFRSRRANEIIYHLASFQLFRGPTVWRWSHYRHHTDTIITGRDAEIVFQRPPSVWRTIFAFTHLQQENVLDHRYNTRTVYMNPLFRFLYSNMNYHVEHHMFPSVPYHALPDLHAEVKDQLAPAVPTTAAAYRVIFSTLARQHVDPTYEIELDVPEVESRRRRIDVGESNWVQHANGGIDLAAASSMDVGELRRIDIEDRTFVLGKLGEDEFILCDGLCTHANIHLADGALIDGEIECPKHNGRFDCKTGEPTRRPVTQPVAVYPVTIDGGRVVGHVNRKATS